MRRTFTVAAVAFALARIAAPAAAQSPPPPITSDQVLSGGCGVGIRAASALAEPGRYLVDMLVPGETPPLAAIIRVDDANGHWLYPATAAPQIVVLVPASAVPPINISAAAAHPPSGRDVACRPSVLAPRRTSDAAPGSDAAVLLPSSNVSDAAVACNAPFAQGGLMAPPLHSTTLAPNLRGQTGTAVLALTVGPDGSIERVRVIRASSAALGAALAQNAQRFHMSPAVFRCVRIESQLFVTTQITGPPGR